MAIQISGTLKEIGSYGVLGQVLSLSMAGWELLSEDVSAFTFQAVARRLLFRFVDDFVVRVRADSGGSRIDARSKSRFGIGDRGANARRVTEYFARVKPLL